MSVCGTTDIVRIGYFSCSRVMLELLANILTLMECLMLGNLMRDMIAIRECKIKTNLNILPSLRMLSEYNV